MIRRVLLIAGLVLGLLGMHGVAASHPVAHAEPVAMLHAAPAAGSAEKADNHGESAPCHREPAPHHDLCKAIRTGGAAWVSSATTPTSRVVAKPVALAPPTPAGASSRESRPPDLSRLGVLRI